MATSTPGRAKRPTSNDVARRAGVSRATVSYVLNDRRDHAIPQATRDRVRAAAEELGYVPNASARALRGAHAPVVLVLTRGIPYGSNVGAILDAMGDAASQAGLSLVSFRHGDARALEHAISHLQVSLVVALAPLGEGEGSTLARSGIPCVDGWQSLDQGASGSRTARLQVECLVAAGRRRLAHLGAAEAALEPFERPRRDGFRAACRELGAHAAHVAQVLRPTAHTLPALRGLLEEWLDGEDPVDGIACYSDIWAAAVLRAAAELGVDVPGRLSVVGVDDEPMAAFTTPPLTTVTLDPSAIGRALMREAGALLGLAAGSAPDGPRLRLVERASV